MSGCGGASGTASTPKPSKMELAGKRRVLVVLVAEGFGHRALDALVAA